jgi:hypothetical protein
MTVPLIGQRPPRLVIGTPTGFMMLADTSHFIQTVYERMRSIGFTVAWGPAVGTYVEHNQNFLCQAAIDQHADALLLIDSDMTGAFTVPERLYQRLRSGGRDILGCDYRCRAVPHFMNGKKLDGTRATGEETGIEEYDFLPAGMLLIARRAILGIGYPWFFNTYGEKRGDFVGNDVNFCRKAREKGFKIWCDHDLSNEVFHNIVQPLARQPQR